MFKVNLVIVFLVFLVPSGVLNLSTVLNLEEQSLSTREQARQEDLRRDDGAALREARARARGRQDGRSRRGGLHGATDSYPTETVNRGHIC